MRNELGEIEKLEYHDRFDWREYLVFSSILLISTLIGIYYGLFDKKNKTNEDFLLGGRQMSAIPVGLSLICSFISAITILGNNVEVYSYGLQYILYAASFIPLTFVLCYVYVPVYFNLRLTSAYEYFERRFNKKLRYIISISSIIHLLLYMPLSVYAPALALEQVANINALMSSAVIFIVCIIYSSIGGLKGVLFTDLFQAIIIFGSLVTICVLGIIDVGGIDIIWERAKASGRTEFFNFDLDPRTRHTFLTGLIGGAFVWIPPYAGSQAQIQRYNSLPTLFKARLALFINLVGLIFLILLCSLSGIIIYAKYYNCDPIGAGYAKESDQLLPFFIMDVMGDINGMPGLFVACLTAGSLSTLSTGLNALAAIISEDFIKSFYPNLPDSRMALISKFISVGTGLVSFALIFVIAAAGGGGVLPFASLLHGALLGPIVAAFSLGMFFPFTNAAGTMVGIVVALGVTLFFGIGSIVSGNRKELPDQKLFLTTDCCPRVNHTYLTCEIDGNDNYETFTNTDWKDKEYDTLITLFSVSYMWQPFLTLASGFLSGFIFSIIFNSFSNTKSPKVHKKYLSPPFANLYLKYFSHKFIERWIDCSEDTIDDSSKSSEEISPNKYKWKTSADGKALFKVNSENGLKEFNETKEIEKWSESENEGNKTGILTVENFIDEKQLENSNNNSSEEEEIPTLVQIENEEEKDKIEETVLREDKNDNNEYKKEGEITIPPPPPPPSTSKEVSGEEDEDKEKAKKESKLNLENIKSQILDLGEDRKSKELEKKLKMDLILEELKIRQSFRK